MNEENKITLENLPPISENERKFWEEHSDEYYHYLYRIDNKLNGKFYYGIHSEKKDGIHKIGEDNYMGSGIALTRAQERYGIENFEKTIIKTFSTRDEARLEERVVVNEKLVEDPNCYNNIIGGGAVSTSGHTAVNYKDEKLRKDNFFLIPTEEYHKNKDKYITPYDNKVTVLKKCDNKYVQITTEEYKNNLELYVKTIIVNYKDKNLRKDKFFSIPLEEYYNNKDKFITVTSGKSAFKNIKDSSDIRILDLNDPLVLSGQFIGVMKGVKQSKEVILKKTGEKNGSYGTMWITNGKENKKIKNTEIPEGWWKGSTIDDPKIKCINKYTLEEKYIKKSLIDFDNWYPYIFFKNNKLITKELLISVSNTSETWVEVAEKLNISVEVVKRMRKYCNITAENLKRVD